MTAPGRTARAIHASRSVGQPTDPSAIAVAILIIMGALAAGLLAADAATLTVAGASALLLVIAMILKPDVATLATIAVIYSNLAVVAVRFHGVPVFLAATVPLLLVVPLARDLIVRRLPVVAPPMLRWMFVLLLIHLVSALFSSDTRRSWDAVITFLVEGIGLYFLLINVIRTPDMLRATTWVLIASGALVSVFSVHQVMTGNFDSNYFGFAQADTAIRTGVVTLTGEVLQPRMAGSIGETNRFAQVMLMLVPLGIFRIIDERRLSLRLLAGAFTLIITLGVVLSFSRGGAVALALLAISLVVLRLVRARYLVVMLVALALILVAFPQYTNRLTTSLTAVGELDAGVTSAVDNSLLSRATETLAAALVIVDHPVIGVGPDMFPIYYEEYAQVVGILIRNDAAREAHNLYLGVGAELGIPGLIVFLIIAYQTVRMLLRARRASLQTRPDLERLTTPFLLALMTYYVTGLFLHLSFIRFYWLMLAIAGAAAIITLRETAADSERQRLAERGTRAERGGHAQRPVQKPVNQSV
jgi:putative inorganic carbon (HCO3(-)) transporter